MSRRRNRGTGHTCPDCTRPILPGQHTTRKNGTWHHRDCQMAAAIAYNRAHPRKNTDNGPARPRRNTGIPAVIASRTGHLDNGTAERVIANGHRKPRTWNEPSPGRHGGGHET